MKGKTMNTTYALTTIVGAALVLAIAGMWSYHLVALDIAQMLAITNL